MVVFVLGQLQQLWQCPDVRRAQQQQLQQHLSCCRGLHLTGGTRIPDHRKGVPLLTQCKELASFLLWDKQWRGDVVWWTKHHYKRHALPWNYLWKMRSRLKLCIEAPRSVKMAWFGKTRWRALFWTNYRRSESCQTPYTMVRINAVRGGILWFTGQKSERQWAFLFVIACISEVWTIIYSTPDWRSTSFTITRPVRRKKAPIFAGIGWNAICKDFTDRISWAVIF